MTDSPIASKAKQSAYSWAITPEELKFQVDNYRSLKITESYRGIAALLILFSICLTIVLSFFSIVSTEIVLGALVLYLPAAYFTYRGHRWAIVVLMVLWTLDHAYSMYASPGIGILIWWAVFMPYFYKALRVENARRESSGSAISQPEENVLYCMKCGNRREEGARFCTSCGAQYQ